MDQKPPEMATGIERAVRHQGRNQEMIDEGQPGFVIAFPGGRGTADMKRRAKKAGLPVREVDH